jgi:hypothetical protein
LVLLALLPSHALAALQSRSPKPLSKAYLMLKNSRSPKPLSKAALQSQSHAEKQEPPWLLEPRRHFNGITMGQKMAYVQGERWLSVRMFKVRSSDLSVTKRSREMSRRCPGRVSEWWSQRGVC